MKLKITIILLFLISFFVSAQKKEVFDIARKGTLEEIKSLYKETPDAINSINDNKYSPLILACYRGNTDVARFLINKVKDINYNTGMGTALMAAVMSDKLEIVTDLINAKADLNQFGADGKTALIYAVFLNKNEIAKALIKAGANKSIKDKDNKIALDYANFNKNTELIILLDQ